MVPEAQHLDALPGEEPVAGFISGPLIREAVSTTIQFDGQFRHGAVEIEEVDPAGILATKLELGEAAVTQQAPEPLLSIRGLLAELAGEVTGSGAASAVFASVPFHPLILSFSPTGGEGVRRTVEGRSFGASFVVGLPPHPDPLPRWGRGNFGRITVGVHAYYSCRGFSVLGNTFLTLAFTAAFSLMSGQRLFKLLPADSFVATFVMGLPPHLDPLPQWGRGNSRHWTR